jgi:hypothetical protein
MVYLAGCRFLFSSKLKLLLSSKPIKGEWVAAFSISIYPAKLSVFSLSEFSPYFQRNFESFPSKTPLGLLKITCKKY